MAKAKGLEVHEHSFIRGPRAMHLGRVAHSHEGGDVPHSHPDTGPATFTIDKDEWFKKTGLRGGGRKRFTAKPTGVQLEIIPREPGEDDFDIIIVTKPGEPIPDLEGSAVGLTAERLRLAHGARVRRVLVNPPPTRQVTRG